MTMHVIQRGECLSLIAARYGFSNHRKMLKDPRNNDFIRRHSPPAGSMDLIYPGEKLFIAPRKQRKATGGTGQRKKFAVERPKRTELTMFEVTCGHTTRTFRQGRTLEVVPSASLGTDDLLITHALRKGHQDGTVSFFLDGEPITGKRVAVRSPIVRAFQILKNDPAVHELTARTCCEDKRSIAVKVYPSSVFSLEVKLDGKWGMLDPVAKVLTRWLNFVTERAELKAPEGSVKFEAAWKEHTDHRAFLAWELGAEASLLAIEVKEFITPLKIVRFAGKIPGVGKYLRGAVDWLLKAGAFVKLTGSIKIKGGAKREAPSADRWPTKGELTLEGEIEPTIGVEASALGHGEDLVMVQLATQASIKASGLPGFNEEGIGIMHFKLQTSDWSGVGILSLLWGRIEAKHKIVFIEGHDIIPENDKIFWHFDA
jgi:hypothetical protein